MKFLILTIFILSLSNLSLTQIVLSDSNIEIKRASGEISTQLIQITLQTKTVENTVTLGYLEVTRNAGNTNTNDSFDKAINIFSYEQANKYIIDLRYIKDCQITDSNNALSFQALNREIYDEEILNVKITSSDKDYNAFVESLKANCLKTHRFFNSIRKDISTALTDNVKMGPGEAIDLKLLDRVPERKSFEDTRELLLRIKDTKDKTRNEYEAINKDVLGKLDAPVQGVVSQTQPGGQNPNEIDPNDPAKEILNKYDGLISQRMKLKEEQKTLNEEFKQQKKTFEDHVTLILPKEDELKDLNRRLAKINKRIELANKDLQETDKSIKEINPTQPVDAAFLAQLNTNVAALTAMLPEFLDRKLKELVTQISTSTLVQANKAEETLNVLRKAIDDIIPDHIQQ
jgi:hypothetical protein